MKTESMRYIRTIPIGYTLVLTLHYALLIHSTLLITALYFKTRYCLALHALTYALAQTALQSASNGYME